MYADLAPGELRDAGYGEVFCHPETAAELLEPGLTIDGQPATAVLVGSYPGFKQVRLWMLSCQDWWCYGQHVVRTASRNRELAKQELVDSCIA